MQAVAVADEEKNPAGQLTHWPSVVALQEDTNWPGAQLLRQAVQPELLLVALVKEFGGHATQSDPVVAVQVPCTKDPASQLKSHILHAVCVPALS